MGAQGLEETLVAVPVTMCSHSQKAEPSHSSSCAHRNKYPTAEEPKQSARGLFQNKLQSMSYSY